MNCEPTAGTGNGCLPDQSFDQGLDQEPDQGFGKDLGYAEGQGSGRHSSQVAGQGRPEPSGGSGMQAIPLALPLERRLLASLRAGDYCMLTGPVYTLRDAGHIRLLAELQDGESPPYGLAGQTLFYAGPTPPSAGRPFGAVGPTTASRMDFAAPQLYRAGIVATIGKGRRSEAVRGACKETSSVYFVATGGAAAFLAKCVESSVTLGYDELGTEALRRVEVVDFPVFVGIDVLGNDIYAL